MQEMLRFDDTKYTIETICLEGRTLTYRAFENIPYVEHPADEDMQRLSIFVPEVYYEGKTVGPYDLKTAPIFMPNTVGGYMPGSRQRPGKDFMGKVTASFYALLHGYVVVSPGVRGREMKDSDGNFIGMAPAMICDLKAAVRYLRYNAGRIPGDVEKIISNGTSAGGAASALLGATGNHPDYEPYLKAMEAANAKDHIFVASCYCPITNLEHGDMAYEWEFSGINDYHGLRFEPPAPGEDSPRITPIHGEMTREQQQWSRELAQMFPTYVNSLGLKDEAGNGLTLDAQGNGTFKDYILSAVAASGGNAMESMDFDALVRYRTRMKQTPAFDNTSLGTPENELFGSEDIQYRHFIPFSAANSKVQGAMAPGHQIRLMNPMNYIEDPLADKAEHFRIRHGSADRDTSLAIPAILALKLKNRGIDTDLAYPWGLPHSGDYDLDELFAWIDEKCSN